MFSAKRGIVVGCLVASGLVASALPALAATAGPAVTISGTTAFAKVTGDAFVEYKGGAADSTAKISGAISGAAAGDVATLYAQPFPYSKAATAVTSAAALTAATGTYSFTVAPTVATRYSVKIFASASPAAALSTSAVQAIYVVSGGTVTGIKTCARPTCHENIGIWEKVPAATLKAEMGARVYTYFAVALNAKKLPATPSWLTLNSGGVTVSKPQKVSATEFTYRIRYTFKVGNDAYHWVWTACTRDVAVKDGLGLPGTHSCGAKRVRDTVTYLG